MPALHDSVTPMGPPSTSIQERPRKRQRDSSPVTPLKRRRVLPPPSTGPQSPPASTQTSSYTSTPLTGPRTREQLDRYYEDVKRDASRIRAVKNQLQILRQDSQDSQDIDAEPESSPEPSESAPMPKKNAIKLCEKILMDNRAIEKLEEERKEVDMKKRGPKRADTDGVVKNTNKHLTRRGKIRREIRNVRKRIGYAWTKLKAAGMVTEPETLPEAAAAADMTSPRISSPIFAKTVEAQPDDDSGAMADKSDSEPSLPTAGRTIARSAMSPSVPPVSVEEDHSRTNGDIEDGSIPTGDTDDADTDASADRGPVDEQVAPEIKSISKPTQNEDRRLVRKLVHPTIESISKIARAPRRAIFTPDSADDEDHSGLNYQEEISMHTAEATNTPVARGSVGLLPEFTKNPINANKEEAQRRPPTPYFPDYVVDSSDDSDSDSEDDSEGESSDVEVKLAPGEDDIKINEVKNHEVKLEVEIDGCSDSDSDNETDVESSDVEVKVEMEDEEVPLDLLKELSEGPSDEKDLGDGAAEDQARESGESQHIVQPDHPEPPASSRPSTGLFERMNGIQTSGTFEAMMADLRRAAAERERQAVLAGQVVDSESSDSSDDDSLPYFSPEPEAKPYIG